MITRSYTFFDHFVMQIDDLFSTIVAETKTSRAYPAENVIEPELRADDFRRSAAYMRVNHTGEVCAQALYRGQAILARSVKVKKTLKKCAQEETDHLAWCEKRVVELKSHKSYLNFFWYSNAFLLGLIVGAIGDDWSLGFIEETEKQVGLHLEKHLQKLPAQDFKSRAIVAQMKIDEAMHEKTAVNLGSKTLPFLIKQLMKLHALVMTTVAHYI